MAEWIPEVGELVRFTSKAKQKFMHCGHPADYECDCKQMVQEIGERTGRVGCYLPKLEGQPPTVLVRWWEKSDVGYRRAQFVETMAWREDLERVGFMAASVGGSP